MSFAPLARQRRHTLYLQEYLRRYAPVFLDTEVDMSGVVEHRAAARACGVRYSFVSYVVQVAGRVITRHPQANSAISGRLRPRVAVFERVDAKVAIDASVDGHRVVVSAVIPDVASASLDEVQARLDAIRREEPTTSPRYAGMRLLHRMPVLVGRPAFRAALRSLSRRPGLLGTFSVTSLGHRPVDGFHSTGGTTVTLGLGRVAPRPVVRDGTVAVAPVMRLSLCFDHRVIDGAEAADLLADLKDGVESFRPEDC